MSDAFTLKKNNKKPYNSEEVFFTSVWGCSKIWKEYFELLNAFE
jgi:hypothetical protein